MSIRYRFSSSFARVMRIHENQYCFFACYPSDRTMETSSVRVGV